jgi:hypothetical protein
MSQLVLEKLAEVRSRGLTVASLSGAGRAVLLFLGVVLLVMLLDFWVELPLPARLVLLIALLAAVGWILWERVISVLRSPPDDDEVALWVERDQPELRQRLISTVQLSRDGGGGGASLSMTRRLIEQTEDLVAPADLSGVISFDPLARWGGGAVAALVGFALLVAIWGADGRDLLLRALCVPGVEVPRKTKIELLSPSPLVIARGDDLTLAARARGVIPDAGTLVVTWASGGTQSYPLERTEVATPPVPATEPSQSSARRSPNEFSITLRSIADSFTYRVLLNDGHSALGEVRASVRPLPQKVEVTIIPPAYSHQPKAKKPTGDLTMLRGSRLELAITASKSVKSTPAVLSSATPDGAGQNRVIFLSPTGVARVFPLARDPANPAQLRAIDGGQTSVQPPDTATGMAILLVDNDGLETKDPTVYRLDLVPDRPPTLRVLQPTRREDIVTRTAQVRIGFEATDDLALASVRLRYLVRTPAAAEVGTAAGNIFGTGGAVDDKAQLSPADSSSAPAADEKLAKSIELDIPPDARSFRGYYPLIVSALGPNNTSLTEGTVVEWWLEALDGNDVTGPGKAASEHYLTRIGTEAQVRDALMTRLTNSFGSLQDTQQSQQDLTQDLGKLITAKPLEKKN